MSADAAMPEHRRLSLLLVEDDVLVRLTAAMLLEEHGFAVVEAASGEEALRLVEGGLGVDALVTDLDLGAGISGPVLAERLRGLWPALPVVFVTGRPASLRDRPRRAGEVYLSKPFDGDALARSVWGLAA